jgi:hypothetical protein
MALVQMRTPGGSYSMVDEKLVPVYEAEGWVLTSELPEFKTKNVTYYDEARKTVTSSKGVEKPVEEVIDEPQIRTLEDRVSQTRKYTDEEYNNLKNTPKEEKLQQIRINRNNGIYLTGSQIYSLTKTYNISESDIRKAESDGKAGKIEQIESGPLQPGEAGFGIDTWYEFLGYDTEDSAMIDFANGKLTAAQIIRAENEIQPEPADLTVSKNTENKINTEVKNYINSTQVTLYKGNQTKKVDYRNAQKFIDDGWTTQSSDEIKAQEIINSYLVTIYKDGNSKQVDVRDVQNWIDQGWSTTAPDEPIVVTETEEETDEYGFTPSQYKSGIPIYRKDAPAGGERVFSNADLKTALGNGYSLTTVDITEGPDAGTSAADAGADKVTSQSGTSIETSTEVIDFNNVPKGAKLTDVDGKLYLIYAVPGQGQLYTGNTMYMAYEVVGNDVFSAGLLTEGATVPTANHTMDKTFFDTVAIVAGNTNQIIGIEDDPFASFVETYSEEAQLRPWLLDPEFIALQAEAAIENRDISDTEWRLTNWYQTHNQAQRAWMDLELSDPAEAARQLNDLEIFYENQLSTLGVSGVPDGLVQWISSKNISGQWSDTYTSEQLKLFSDPYKSGDRDAELQNLISTSGFGDVDRTAAREREVVELYRKWLGPTLGSLTQDEVASIAGRLRDDPDYEDALIQNLKQNRLAAFSNYTNPELTYEDIARPWRNLTTSVWGQTADETQGWWQEMVKSNDFATAQETLRTKGLEQNVTQVTQDATKALQQALGQGQVSQLGVNV